MTQFVSSFIELVERSPQLERARIHLQFQLSRSEIQVVNEDFRSYRHDRSCHFDLAKFDTELDLPCITKGWSHRSYRIRRELMYGSGVSSFNFELKKNLSSRTDS